MTHKTWPKQFNLKFVMEGDRPLLVVELYLPWSSLLRVAQAIRWAARLTPAQGEAQGEAPNHA
jgi:hypothetical protein